MHTLHVHLFSKFTICCNEDTLSPLETYTMQGLLGYLLLNRQKPHSREALADLLWPESSLEQARKNLRQTLWQIHRCLEPHLGHYHELLLVDNDWVEVNLQADVWLDVSLFEHDFSAIQGIAAAGLNKADLHYLQEAADLYRGDLLEGCYHNWCLSERERFRGIYLLILDKLLAYYERQQDLGNALLYAGRILHLDSAHERTHQRLMKLYYLLGDRTSALRQYQLCCDALDRELGVGPDPSTSVLYHQILSATHLTETESELTQHTAAARTSLQQILAQLDELKKLLNTVQTDVKRNIDTVEAVMKTQEK